jgi:hypothetical protein
LLLPQLCWLWLLPQRAWSSWSSRLPPHRDHTGTNRRRNIVFTDAGSIRYTL